MAWAVLRFVYESWTFKEVAQGLIKIPIWIPQMSFVLGVLIFFVAVLDEFVAVLRGGKPAYQARRGRRGARAGDFSRDGLMTPLVAIAVALFALLLVLLAGGVWIAISLAAVAWLGLQLFTTTRRT